MMTYYYFRYCPSSWKRTITVVYTPSSHFQSPTFKNITSVKFTSVLHRRTMSVVAKPDISILWPPKPKIITSLELWQIASKFQRNIQDFRRWRARYKRSQMIATTIDHQKLHNWRPKRLYCYFSVVCNCRNRPGVSFFELGVVENLRFAAGIVTLSVIVPDI